MERRSARGGENDSTRFSSCLYQTWTCPGGQQSYQSVFFSHQSQTYQTMSSPAIALPSPSPAKAPTKRAKSLKRAKPTLSKRILKAVAASKSRGGLSLAGLKKSLKAGGYDIVKNRTRIVLAIKRLVAKKALVRTKGSGASGSFKVNKKAPKPRKRVVKKRKPKTKKTKKATKGKGKKAGASPAKKKKATKKKKKATSPKKAKKTTPRKARKPAAKKAAKSPKRAKRRVAKAKTAAAAKK